MGEVATALSPRVGERAIAEWLSGICGCRVRVRDWQLLTGGAIQQNWKVELEFEVPGESWHNGPYVLRTDAASSIGASLDRGTEFEVLRAASEAGVPCPEPLALLQDEAGDGASMFLMRWCPGVAAGHRLVRDDALVPERSALARDIGRTMAQLHAISPAHANIVGLAVEEEPTRSLVAGLREYLDTLGVAYPVIELALREVEVRLRESEDVRLVHRDLRTGNYLVHDGRLSAVLDWEFAAWANPMEDLGWFTAKCWRFGAIDREAGGIGPLNAFLDGYAQGGGMPVDPGDLLLWQLVAHVRWAVIAFQQAQRHLRGTELSLELALTGRLVPQLEAEMLELLERL